MANDDHLTWINEGVGTWNARRQAEPFEPDLSDANLRDVNLASANLSGADLTDANLTSTGRLDGAPRLDSMMRTSRRQRWTVPFYFA